MLVTACTSTTAPNSGIEVMFLNDGQVISTEGFHTYSVQLTNKDGETIDAQEVYIYINMEMMNHPIEGTMQKGDTGLYELDLPLAMAGDWYVNVSVTIDGNKYEFSDFSIIAEGPKQMEYMKGYNADNQ